jgi:hypothetical protein
MIQLGRQTRRDCEIADERLNAIPKQRLEQARNHFQGVKLAHLKRWADNFCKRNAQENSPVNQPDRLTSRRRERMLGWFAEQTEAWNSMYDPEAEQQSIQLEERIERSNDFHESD